MEDDSTAAAGDARTEFRLQQVCKLYTLPDSNCRHRIEATTCVSGFVQFQLKLLRLLLSIWTCIQTRMGVPKPKKVQALARVTATDCNCSEGRMVQGRYKGLAAKQLELLLPGDCESRRQDPENVSCPSWESGQAGA